MTILSPLDKDYPRRLALLDAPPVVYASEPPSIGSDLCVLFSGTRRPDHQAFHDAWVWSLRFARLGWRVVTSLEGGCDLAVRRALASSAFKPIVTVAGELPKSRDETMVLVSPFPEGTNRCRETLLGRNAFSASLCHLTVIVQAPMHSGSLLVARDALDSGGEVLLLPCAVGNGVQHAGGNRLREEGAPILRGCVNRTSFVVDFAYGSD
ncbi:MAG: DNA-processing protein DprA [Sphaerochaetaceae bacterium]|nr:DNA-processing protein DprA [Spirochaetales bacterium]MDY5500739.1 DNA-processing protein DprA [Sphaerochaetaceae bacterium]